MEQKEQHTIYRYVKDPRDKVVWFQRAVVDWNESKSMAAAEFTCGPACGPWRWRRAINEEVGKTLMAASIPEVFLEVWPGDVELKLDGTELEGWIYREGTLPPLDESPT